MTAKEYLARRNEYLYPAVGLDGAPGRLVEREFASIRAVEDHHRRLLRSSGDARAVVGYLSVLYWGHSSGKHQRSLRPRALARVRLAQTVVGHLGVSTVAARIRKAVDLVDAGHYGEALIELSHLPQLKFAFASKVCAFILPEQCGVIDSVIATAHRQFGFALDPGGYVRTNAANARRYTKYCAFLATVSSDLNAKGHAFKWRDRDGTRRPWRAVDVERAMYEA